jgi:uncharacterized protein (DUF2062 family)
MVRRRVAAYRNRIREELERAFREDRTPHEIAASFAFGSFVTMLPTLGTGLILFVLVTATVARVSKIALFGSVLVFNPAVKWGVYGASFWLGSLVLGPVTGVSLTSISLSAGPEVVIRLLVGNLILAIVAAICGYFVVYRLAVAYHRRGIDLTDLVPEPVVEKQ